MKKRGSSLTLRILAVNVLAPLTLLAGLLYMDQYRDNLIRAELETLRAQAQVFAGAISEGAVRPVQKGRPFLFARPQEMEVLIPELSRRMVRRLGNSSDSRTQLFATNGVLIGDSNRVTTESGAVNGPPDKGEGGRFSAAEMLHTAARAGLSLIPNRADLQPYPRATSTSIADYPDAAIALRGKISATAWLDEKGRIVLTAAAPVTKVSQIMGVVYLTRDAVEIERAMNDLRFDVLTVFIGSLSLTIFLSLYLASTIGRPLKKLARAAEQVRTGKGRAINIPYLTHRHDEIGDLSIALHDMTNALWDRMDSIERFAADVSHEIKNPLTSVRSAVETAALIKDPAKRDKLMDIILHDVKRLDRLITDISSASRVDAELSRDAMEDVDLNALLQQIVDAKRAPLERAGEEKGGGAAIDLVLQTTDHPVILGNYGRLAQVFENLLTNAISFSPEGGKVQVRIEPAKNDVLISIEDNGPGIPEGKLEAIFERFYTERPKHEAYGSHSGLGLSIARQIVEAHKGLIWAENRPEGGARFAVQLPRRQG